MNKLLLIFCITLLVGTLALPMYALNREVCPIVPEPKKIQTGLESFLLTPKTTLAVSDLSNSELRRLAAYGATLIEQTIGFSPLVSTVPIASGSVNTIILQLTGKKGKSDEMYGLCVTPEYVTIKANTTHGIFYGLQSLRQLLPVEWDGSTNTVRECFIPEVTIEDAPRFAYRGIHLDVARHFFPPDFIKQYIDFLAMYKMNTLHWHLTEDQGWRVEIKKYPLLTEVGAYRKETMGDGVPHGGFYSQEEIRDIVTYARERYITIIPEIELPGHCTAALAAYPEFACTPGPFEVSTTWGVHKDIYCPSEETFSFLQDVLTEVMDVFPSHYIHIGGDEVPKIRWKNSPLAQEVMQREGLANEDELQSYFIKRIETFLLAHGRQLIGWDEILEGGLAPEATVMSWRGMAGGVAAAKQGHDVIMTPYTHMYFDYYQGDSRYEPRAIGGFIPLKKVYEFEPIPPELTNVESVHVLGAQANLWTEYMKTSEHVEYMLLPRMLALSEVVWSPKKTRNWERFVAKLSSQFCHLGLIDANYRVPHIRGLQHDRIGLEDEISIVLTSLISDGKIRYTVDGSNPDITSRLYEEPLELPLTQDGFTLKARAFLLNGRMSPLRSAAFRRVELLPAVNIIADPGIGYAYFEFAPGAVSSVDQLSDLKPLRERITPKFGLQGDERQENFGLQFTGYVHIPQSGIYTFFLSSDDGSKLRIGNQLVIDHDGYHGTTEKIGMIALEGGFHTFDVAFFQGGGAKSLALDIQLECEPDDGVCSFKRTPIDSFMFYNRH